MSFEIKEADGKTVGESDVTTLTLPWEGVVKMFTRNAIRMNGGGHYRTLVAEMDGVRCYVRERDGRINIIMTKADLYE